MRNFQLSEQADPNKIFLTKFSELEGRFDPFYYKSNFISLNNRINNSPFKVQKLHQISKNIVNGFDCRDYVDNSSGITYLKVSNIKMDNIDINKVEKIPYQEIHKDSIIKKDDLLLTRKGTFGISAVVKTVNNNSVISSEIFKILLKDKENSLYLSYWFNTKASQAYFNRIKTGAIMGHITQEALRLFPIPIPPKNIQADIVAKMDTAYQEKQSKETQAQNLLNSIDDYLLDELGIDFPKQTDNSLKARIFTKKFSEVVGGRLNAEYYQKKYIDFDYSLNNAKYKISNIDNIITSIVSGSTPKSGGSAYQDNGKYHFIRLTNFNNSMEVDLSKSLFIKQNIHYEFLERSKLKKGDVLFGIAGSIGKIAIYNHNENANINQAIARLRFKDNINYIYVAYLLDSNILKYQIERNKRPVAQPNLNTEELKSLKIPLPPLEKQNQIAEHISKIRDQAKQLQTEAKTGLEQAKQEIETMILGGDL